MKKIKMIAAAVLVTITSIATAQDLQTDNREEFQFGIKAGLNYSNVYHTRGEDFDAEAKIGLTGGAVVRIPIGKYLGLHPEILFSQKGFKGRGTLFGSPYNFTRTTSYIDVPLLFAFKPSEFITLLAGPQYSYLLKQRDEFTNSTVNSSVEQEFKNDNIRKNIFGFVGGFDINLKHIVLGARIGWDIQNNNANGTSVVPRYKNAWLQASVGYSFYKHRNG